MLSPSLETRLFPKDYATASYHQQHLAAIKDMCVNWPAAAFGLNAGYTYWGQFLAHELGPRPGLEPRRSAVLDLDSLYGETGWGDPRIAVDSTGKFLLGETVPVSGVSEQTFDLERDDTGRPLIPEIRNDENLIIAQFHLLLQRAHNAIVLTLLEHTRCSPGGQAFKSARKILTGIFHELTRDEYLRAMTQEATYAHIFTDGNRYLKLRPDHPLPVEISQAAFRFGHSQVREEYRLSKHQRVSLARVFELVSGRDITSKVGLPADHAINWKFFFNVVDHHQPFGGNRIDPGITPGMQALENGTRSIIEMNLVAGINALLPSGQGVVEALLERFPALQSLGMDPHFTNASDDTRARMETANVLERTPLWIYILAEAGSSATKGVRLGPLGSLMLCEVLRNAMDNAEIDYSRELQDFIQLAGTGLSSLGELIAFISNAE